MYTDGVNLVVLTGSKTANQNQGLFFPDSHVPLYTMRSFDPDTKIPGLIQGEPGVRPVIYPEQLIEVKRAPAVAPHPLCVTQT